MNSSPREDAGLEEDEAPEPRSVLGLPTRLLLALGSVGFPLLAVAAFSSLHDWPPPPPCPMFAIFGCPSAPFPVAVHGVDWVYLVGPLLGFASAVGALRMSRDAGEAGLPIYRYAIPVVGLLVCVGCAGQLVSWLTQAGK